MTNVPYFAHEFEIDKPVKPMIDRVKTLEKVVNKMTQYEPVTRHYFHGGMYVREVEQHADVLVIGCEHLTDHFFQLFSGTLILTMDEGVTEITGPAILKSPKGTKRAIYSVTDAIYATVHLTAATTIEEAEIELVVRDPESPFGPGNKLKCLPEGV